MHRHSNRTTEPVMGEAFARRFVPPCTAERRIVILGVILTAIALAYFQAANHHYLSTRRMTPIFQYLLTVEDPKTAWLTLGVCVLAAFWKNSAALLRVVDFVGSKINTIVMASVALLGVGAVFVYHNNAFCMDEYAAVFQAKIFAAGRLTSPLPPSVVGWRVPPGFNKRLLAAARARAPAPQGCSS